MQFQQGVGEARPEGSFHKEPTVLQTLTSVGRRYLPCCFYSDAHVARPGWNRSMPKTEVPAALPGGKPPGAKPKQGKKKVFLGFLVFLLVAAGGGGAAYWKFFMSAAPAEASAGTDTNSTVPAP